MGDPTNGITCPDMRRVVREALSKGWEWGGFTGTTHARIVWPPTGEHKAFGLTPSVASWKTLATDVQRISGVEVWRKGNRKRSRKADQLSGFSLDHARRENGSWGGSWDERVDQLKARREGAVRELQRLVRAGDRTSALKAREVLEVVRTVEAELEAFHQPVTPFSLADLAG